MIGHAQATLAFPETGKLAGNGSCNRFFGPADMAACFLLDSLGVIALVS
jgi:heat shock protein HslJ